jgi:hypothetical protein
MAITSGQTAVGTTPTMIDGVHQMPYRITFQNIDNTDAVFVGGPDVTINNGYRLEKLNAIQLVINPLDALYAISGKTGHSVCWIRETL